ncbi:MAG TPA: glycosyltransferase family 2 protein, partial [Bacteroidales bacterium]|nr:glycosyltransferase family 2 protein [Bacteroidales bacterium]
MDIIVDILEIFQLVFYLYIATSVLMLFVFSVASLFPYKPLLTNDGIYRKVALIIPAYREDNVILEVVQSALRQQ